MPSKQLSPKILQWPDTQSTPNNSPDAVSPRFELSVIVPTFNERENIEELIARLEQVLKGRDWEVIFVDDDSPDGTADLIREIAEQNKRVRCIHRIGRRGLSSACIEGMLSSSATYVAIIDADMQHDEKLLSTMLDVLEEEELDIVSGSRYMKGGSLGEWAQSRAGISKVATWLSKVVSRAKLTDPMSGFFMIRRQVFEDLAPQLSGIGFKILLDIFASSSKPLRYRELPYQFRCRQAGVSKLDGMVAWEYILLLLEKSVGQFIPVRFISFAMIGALGVFVHLLLVDILYKGFGDGFTSSQSIATVVAMTSNYTMNNLITYRDKRLRGWRWLRGWASFALICSVGALANVGIASFLFHEHITWVLASISGILVGAVWNYTVSATYTWNKPSA
ncbi:glycosyltransferase [Kaarinaea lacus]